MRLSNTTKLWLLFIAAFALLVFSFASCAEPVYAQETVVIKVDDFGKGMTPVLPAWRNDPSAITFSQNMYSTQPGGRQLRFGYTKAMPLLDTVPKPTGAVTSIALFQPKSDSGSLIWTAAGTWYSTVVGIRNWGITINNPGEFLFSDTSVFQAPVRPFHGRVGSDSLIATGDSVYSHLGTTRFVRDLQAGDSVTLSGETHEILRVISDTKLRLTVEMLSGDTVTSWTFQRIHDATGVNPYLLQSGEYMYTGTHLDPPQVIYRKDDTLRIRPLGIVDSIFIDTAYTRFIDSVTGISYDTTAAGAVLQINRAMLVDRSAVGKWSWGQWGENIDGNPVSYYCRLGAGGVDKPNWPKTFDIITNDDTALIIKVLFVDSTQNETYLDTAALYTGDDTTWAKTLDGTYAYIYASVGNFKVAVSDTGTNDAIVSGGGTLWRTVDSAGSITDTANQDQYNYGMYFIHLLSDAKISPRVIGITKNFRVVELKESDGRPAIDSATERIWHQDPKEWKCSRSARSGSQCFWYIKYYIETTVKQYSANFIADPYFPISHMYWQRDTLFILTNGVRQIADAVFTTDQWEIVEASLPQWAGMTEWNNPAQLVAWGDTSSVSLLSFSGQDDPWDWNVNKDVLVGLNPSEPIVSVVGYDNQLVIFKQSSMTGFDGESFKELSQTDGLVAPRAVVGLTKELYWLDVDGVKKMARRDFSGYSIQKVSTAIDPILNSWNANAFGSDVIPRRIVPAYRSQSILTYNQRDRHLYLFGTFDTLFPPAQVTNNACLTYDIESGLWDGYMTIPATDAIWATVRDTSRILIGSPDSATVFAMDYAYLDDGIGIDLDIKSAKFQIEDQGWPVKSKLKSIWFNGRGASGLLDGARVLLIGENATDTFNITFNSGIGDFGKTYYSSKDNLSKYWQWQIKAEGKDATGSLFQPHELRMEFIPVAREH